MKPEKEVVLVAMLSPHAKRTHDSRYGVVPSLKTLLYSPVASSIAAVRIP
jgi:hypothetical protein